MVKKKVLKFIPFFHFSFCFLMSFLFGCTNCSGEPSFILSTPSDGNGSLSIFHSTPNGTVERQVISVPGIPPQNDYRVLHFSNIADRDTVFVFIYNLPTSFSLCCYRYF